MMDYTEMKDTDLWEHKQRVADCVRECQRAWPQAAVRALQMTENPFGQRRPSSATQLALGLVVLLWAGLAAWHYVQV